MKPAVKPTRSETTVPPEAPRRDFRTRQLFLACAGLILVSGVLVTLALFHLRSEAIQSGERLTASFVHIVAEQTKRSIQLVDQRLQSAVSGIAQLDANSQLNEQKSRTLLKQQLIDLPLVRAIWFLNTEGRIKFHSDTGNIGLNLADRDYFQIFRTQPQTTFYVGLPIRSRTTGSWLISVARPVQSADGKFAGAIVAALEPSYFQTIWRQADFGAGVSVALWRRDGTLMMRSPIDEEDMGENFSARPLFSQWLPASPVGAFQNISLFDGDLRSLAYRTLSTQPNLVVVVTQSLALILKPWREFAMLALTFWIIAVTMLIGLCLFVSRMWKQRALAEAAGQEITQRLALATDVASMGIWEWNVNAGTFYASPKCFTMLGDEPGDGLRSREQWLERIHPEDRRIVDETVSALLRGPDRDYVREVRMRHADGTFRWVSVAYRMFVPNTDGTASRILGVRMDITARKQVEESLRNSESQFRALVNAIPDLIFSSDRDGQFLSVHASDPSALLAPPEAFIDRRFDDSLPQPIAYQFTKAFAEATTSGQMQVLDYTLTVNEAERHFEARVVPSDADTLITIVRDITERKRVEAALRESEERYRALVECSPEPILVHRVGTITFVNPAALKMLAATSVQEVLGRSMLDLVHPGSRHIIQAQLKSLAAGSTESTHYELKFVSLDGKTIAVELRGTIITLGGAPAVQCSMRDITAATEAADALRKSEAALAEAQRVAQVGSWSWQAATDTFEWSDELFRILGLELSSSGPNFETQLKLFTDESAAQLADAVQKAVRFGEPYNVELECKYSDGERRWVGVRGEARRSASGRIFGLRGTVQNITERKLAEAARTSLEAQLRESQKMQAIGTLAGGIAHDFNNILATILGNAALARADLHGNAPALQSLDEISKASARARDLVQQILSFSRREPMHRKPTALAPVVDESVRLLRATMPPRVALDIHCAAELPSVLADANQIQQIVINLATNALQAMRDRPGHISIRLGTAVLDEALAAMHPGLRTMGAAHGTRLVRLVVSDDGPGMDATTLARIFEPFFTTKPVDEGTGLGLSVVHGIVHAHEGVILVDSLPGNGTTFTIYFPAADDHVDAVEAQAPPLAARSAEANGQHILYIDDDEALVFLVTRTLERRGFRVSGYSDQRQALDALGADAGAFDLVVTDYNMPGMSGLEVAHKVRAIRPNLPLAIASGFIDETLLAKADEAGVREVISKANAVEALCDAFVRLANEFSERSKSRDSIQARVLDVPAAPAAGIG